MKKFFCLITIFCIVAFAINAYAKHIEKIEALKVDYPIIIDGKENEKEINMVLIDDRIYLPIRSMCEALGFDIEWTEEKNVKINTNAQDVNIDVGYYGREGWVNTNTLEIEISKETAINIANDVFLYAKGSDYINETAVKVKETTDGEMFIVYRYKEPITPGEDVSVIIRKSDGKIMRVELGE